MMAKMFYTMEETKAALGKTEDEIKQLSREGRLREFRDGPRLMFKADAVDQLKGEGGGTRDHVDLGPSDSGAPIGLVDSAGASGTGIKLTDSDVGAGGPGGSVKGDTALAADLGLSGSVGGVPSPGRVTLHSASGSGLAGSAGGSRSGSGINVFSSDEVEHVDPGAQTAISPALREQVNLEGVGSGSGLLDLTRESDDTSLGAELLDEIAPGNAATVRRPSAGVVGIDSAAGLSGAGLDVPEARGLPSRSGVTYVEASDPAAPAFGGAALGAVFVSLFGAFVLINAVGGVRPQIVQSLVGDANHGIIFFTLIGIVISVIFFVIGLLLGKAVSR